MLPEAGALELVFLAMVALIVVGPKDLPVLLRKLGQFTAKMRGLASEFRSSFDEMARQSELDELRREVDALREGRFGDAHKPEIESHLSDINAGLSWSGPTASVPAPIEPPAAGPQTLTFDAEAEPELPLPPPEPRASAPVAEPAEPQAAHARAAH